MKTYCFVYKTEDSFAKSQTPKEQHKILGKSIFEYTDDLANKVGSYETAETIAKLDFDYEDNILFLNSAMPLLDYETINSLLKYHLNNCSDVTVLTNDSKKNFGIFCFNKKSIDLIKNNIMKIEITSEEFLINLESNNLKIDFYSIPESEQLLLIDDRLKLYKATEYLKKKINFAYMENGVTIIDPKTAYISIDAIIGVDTVIYPNVIIEGKTEIGQDCILGSNSKIVDSVLKNNVSVESSIILNSVVGHFTNVGPFAYIRPNCVIGQNCKVGDFVEIKNSKIGNNTKASHLTYIGDSDVGNNINFGCGTITVNYDGFNKYRTTIKDNAFIGCNTNLIAPVTVGENSFIAAGATITEDVPQDGFAIARSKQTNKINWRKDK